MSFSNRYCHDQQLCFFNALQNLCCFQVMMNRLYESPGPFFFTSLERTFDTLPLVIYVWTKVWTDKKLRIKTYEILSMTSSYYIVQNFNLFSTYPQNFIFISLIVSEFISSQNVSYEITKSEINRYWTKKSKTRLIVCEEMVEIGWIVSEKS